jgi:deoxyribodipyrimidine photo-lyase
MQFLRSIDCRYLYSNIEYEVDELRRDIEICKLSQEQAVKPTFTHDKCIIEPATLFTGQGKPYTVSCRQPSVYRIIEGVIRSTLLSNANG